MRTSEGFTLLEVMIAVTIFAVVVGSIFMVAGAATKAIEVKEGLTYMRLRIGILTEDLTAEIKDTSVDDPSSEFSLADMAEADQLTFKKVTGWQGSAPEWGELVTLRLDPAPGETLADGIDNNKNGLVDERVCVAQEGTGEARPLGSGVYLPANGLSFRRVGSNIEITVIGAAIDTNRNYFEETVYTTVTVRN